MWEKVGRSARAETGPLVVEKPAVPLVKVCMQGEEARAVPAALVKVRPEALWVTAALAGVMLDMPVGLNSMPALGKERSAGGTVPVMVILHK